MKLLGEDGLTLVRESYQTNFKQSSVPVYTFAVTVSEYLIRYMLLKHIFIRVVDAETHFGIGYCLFPLDGMLRGSKASEMNHRELEIVSFDWK
jgi:hypothetical protein